jgi:hypothetical protein
VGTVDDLYNAKTSARPGFKLSLDDQRKFKGPDIDGMAETPLASGRKGVFERLGFSFSAFLQP